MFKHWQSFLFGLFVGLLSSGVILLVGRPPAGGTGTIGAAANDCAHSHAAAIARACDGRSQCAGDLRAAS